MVLQHGNFDAGDALVTSRALAGFAVGLVGFSVYLFLLRGFYAHDDAKTPFTINLFENVINIVLAFVLVDEYGVLGLGLAFSIAYLVSALLALQVMSYKVRGFPVRTLLAAIGRMLVAALVMAEVLWLVARAVGANAGIEALLRVTVAGVAGLVAYVVVLAILRVPELDQLRGRLVRRTAPET
jgi:putative peptidoglycan lipid II flippase